MIHRAWRIFAVAIFGLMVAAACSAVVPANQGADNVTWVCIDDPSASSSEPCHCQTSPVLGNPQFVDHCDATSVSDDAGASDVHCCKRWIVLNGQKQRPWYCSCYAGTTRDCNSANGNETVDRCP